MESIAILVIEKGRARVMRFRVELTGEANWSLASHTTSETLKKLKPDLVTVVESENRARWLAEEFRRQGRADAVILLHPETGEKTTGQSHISLSGEIDPGKPRELVMRLAQALFDAQSKEPANPLTGLPGARVLRAEAERRIGAGEKFVFLYLDLDNFKAYNDYYGFAKGDDAIRLLAEIVLAAVKARGDITDLSIHIGGDDFGVLTEPARAEAIAAAIIEKFDAAAPALYDKPEQERGYIVTTDRQGNEAQFPIMSVTIVGVGNQMRSIEGYLHLSEIAAEMKNFAKRTKGSNFAMDRRRDDKPKTKKKKSGG